MSAIRRKNWPLCQWTLGYSLFAPDDGVLELVAGQAGVVEEDPTQRVPDLSLEVDEIKRFSQVQ